MTRIRLFCAALAVAAMLALTTGVTPAHAASNYFCSGYTSCIKLGYSASGYQAVNKTMYWRMSPGHNCTNYVAYRMIQKGFSALRPWVGSGNAYNWGPTNKMRTDRTPVVGAVAWWKANVKGAGKNGHVAYVEQVISADEIIISEDNWGGNFHWRRVRRESGWPTGFIHYKDAGVGSPRGSLDGAVSTASHRVTLRGWAADPGAPKSAVRIQAYVGGRPGIGKKVVMSAANDVRADVAKSHPQYGAKHGFEQTITTGLSGQVVIYVYGLDAPGTSGTTALLGRATVNVRY